MRVFFKDKFNLIMSFSIVVILILILIFVYLNLNTAPHVRFVEINGDQNSLGIKDQRVKVYFSGPMNKDSSAHYVTINPSANFSTSWSNNTLFIIFKGNLIASTDYQIKISKDMKDVYGKNLTEDFLYNFKTENLHLAYIQKNSQSDQQIILADPDFQNPKVLFQTSNIKLFALNKDYLVVVTDSEGIDSLQFKNLKTGEIKKFDLGSVTIDRLDFSPVANQFIYLTQEIEKKDEYTQPSNQIDLNLYDIDSGTNKILNSDYLSIQIIDMKYSADGGSILFKSSDSYYYIIPIDNPSDKTVLERFLADGGFNKDSDKIIYIAYDPLSTYTKAQYLTVYTSDRKQKKLTNGDVPVLDPEYDFTDDDIIFAQEYKELPTTKGIYEIVKIDNKGNEKVLLKDEDRSLELPRISPDDRYIVIERYTKQNLLNFEDQRNYLFQTKPSSASLIVLDQKDKKLIDNNIIGIEAMWVY